MDQRFNELMLKNTEKYPYVFHTMVQPHRATIQVVHPKTVKLLMKSTEPKDDITGGIYMHLMPWLGKIGSKCGTNLHRFSKEVRVCHTLT